MPTSGDPRIENEIAHGRTIAREGEEVWNWSSPAGRERWRRRASLFVSFLGNHHRDVLEIGCGTGLFTEELSKTANRITAIDISEDLLALAGKRVSSPNVVFMIANAYDSGFADASFDCVVGSSVLHHLEIDRALHEIRRLLRPGGSFMFTEPNMLNPQIAIQKNIPFVKRLAGDSPDETAFVRFLLARKIAKAGFDEIVLTPFDFLHPAIPEALLRTAVPLLARLENVPLLREIAGSLVIKARKP